MHRPDVRGAGALPEEWQASTVGNLSQADGTHRQADRDMVDGVLAIRQTNAERNRQRDTVHSQFAQKIRNTEELAQQLNTRLRCNKVSLEHCEWSLGKLNTALQALRAPTELCKSRILMRDKRPKRERVYDPFQEALLNEEKALQAAKQKFMEAIADTQRHVKMLMQHREELTADLNDKKHALYLDSTCVDKKAIDRLAPLNLDRSYNRKSMSIKMVVPEILGTPRDSPETAGRAQERDRQKATFKNIEAAMRAEQATKERWQQTADLLDKVQAAIADAFRTTQTEMGAKIEHTELLKQELAKQGKLTDQKIAETQKTLNIVTEKLNALEKPIVANAQRTNIRGHRTAREAINDEVSEALHNQQHALQAKKMQLQAQANALMAAINELNTARGQILEDIADKDRALAIDRSCAAAKNDAHGNLSYGFAKVGQGQRHFADTASSKMRQMPTPTVTRSHLMTG
mmetsp:Transcript_15464/g.42674  ORF Transcript_15464/g.42674 Transcript_15464/m.42674 type:complete len:461 (-) Transcript_15464:120-1502(-)|eukprot:CAMPEP_0179065032 /NCGR_PEP_ID=MMETSP0796-20121207/28249_1 /TAXON_ID=73915 /ORGANISM="Pyrodinium bahamense, Strain pbaha01" /LENGTH=460 /DNA_ID=CAMNT_0020761987 /DNA_START=51 /DNA_END=1433 /DNA_ORIENTATION=+